MSTPTSVEVVEVIFVSTSRGDGTPSNPLRSVHQYWSKDGRLLAETDAMFHCPESASYMAAERLNQLHKAGTSASEHMGGAS
ncbi:hypothetical protein [Variovorax sp. tm]|uniref:hypothetical protein n=1 Tax=Variovorax atrisoli TaxID=3394203 RepID=UPI003A804541